METAICCVFFVLESWQIQTTKRNRLNTLIFERNYLKRLIFYRAYNKNEEHKYSRSEFYYPERSNTETYSGIGERQDDFIKKQKSANTNKKMATDLNTLPLIVR